MSDELKNLEDSTNKTEDGNWVKEHRRIVDHAIWRCPYIYQMWRFLIMQAKWQNDIYSDGHIKICLKRGQLVCSLNYLSRKLGTPKPSTHRRLKTLRKWNAIEMKVDQGHTVVTVLNYTKYQCSKNERETQVERKWNESETQHETQMDPSKEVNKLTKEERKNLNPSRGAKSPTAGSLVWTSYSEAYKRRYGVEATRNAKANALCTQFVKRLGIEDSPPVIEFYVTHNDRWYVQKCHSLEYAIKDAEKLHMEWKNGRQMTSIAAKNVELQSNNDEVFKEHLRRHYGK